MATSIFEDRGMVPDDAMVASAIADTYIVWNELKDHVKNNYSSVNEEWKNYGKSSGWVLLVKIKKRTLFYMIPKNGYFSLNFVLGGKAAEAAEESSLPEEIKEKIRSATPYVEGRSVLIDIRSPDQIGLMKLMMGIKYKN